MFPVAGHLPTPELDNDGKLFNEVVKQFGRTTGTVDGVNKAMDLIKEMLRTREFENKGDQGWTLSFRNPDFLPPESSLIRESEKPKGSWMMELLVDLVITVPAMTKEDEKGKKIKTKKKTRVIKHVSMGKIPVITGSKYDPYKSEEDQIANGIDPRLPKGVAFVESYFREFNMFENLRVNEILCYIDSGNDINDLISSITTESRYGKTAQISIFMDKNGIIRFASFRGYIQEKKKPNNLSALAVFLILNYKDLFENEASLEDFVLMFTRPEWREKIRMVLSHSFNDFYMLEKNPDQLVNNLKAIQGADKSLPYSLPFFEVQMEESLYTHIGTESGGNMSKLALLAVQICRFAEVFLELRPMNNRDSYAVKRFKNLGGSMYHLFGIFLEHSVEKFRTKYNPHGNIDTDDAIKSIFQEQSMTDHYINSFTKSWGLQGKPGMKNNVYCEIWKIDSFMIAQYHVGKTVRGRDLHSKKYSIRKMQGTQKSKNCVAETPENAKCGLNNTQAAIEYNSQHYNEDLLMELIELWRVDKNEIVLENEKNKDLEPVLALSFQREENGAYDTLLVVNADIKGICPGKLLYDKLLESRRNKAVEKDICIFFDLDDKYLYINTDAGRPTAPLLVMDPEGSGELLLDKKGLQNESDPQKLFDEGVIDFVDAKEEEYKAVAYSREHIYELKRQMEQLQEKERIIKQVRKSMRKNPDLTFVRGIEDPEIIVTKEEREEQVEARYKKYLKQYLDFVNEYEPLAQELEDFVTNAQENMPLSYPDKYLELIGKINRLTNEMNRYDPESVKALSKPDIINKDIVTKKDIKHQMTRTREQISQLKRRVQYQYCEIDQNAIFGVTASVLKFSNHNPGPRQTFGCKMVKQAKSLSSHAIKWKPYQTKYLTRPTPAISETQMGVLIGLDDHPVGQSVYIVINSGGDLIEDSFRMSRGFALRGGYGSNTVKVLKETFKLSRERGIVGASLGAAGARVRTLVSNNIPKEIRKKHPGAYRNLDNRGVIIPGSVVKIGDCILGRYREHTSSNGEVSYYDLSIYAKRSKVGTVWSVNYNDQDSENVMLQVNIRQAHIPQIGDKFSPSHAQKCTIGTIVKDSEMLYSVSGANKGMPADIVIDTHAFPSRMTIGMLIEIILSKSMVLIDKRVNATSMKAYPLDEAYNLLYDHNYEDSMGKERFVNPLTGKEIQEPLYAGFCYYYCLVHESGPKLQNRYVGAYKRSTGQPITGIDNVGGQRYGEMEFESFYTHGGNYTAQQCATRNSDLRIVYSCKRCNTQVYPEKGLFYCRTCNRPAELLFAESTHTGEVLRNYSEAFGTATNLVLQPINSETEA